MQQFVRGLFIASTLALAAHAPASAEPLPGEIAKTLARSGLPLKSFGFYVRPVDAGQPDVALAALNEEQPFLMASTAKIVTSLAALDMLGPAHRLQSSAFATGPLHRGRLAGDLVITGGAASISAGDLMRWFKQMRAEGLSEVSGDIVLERVPITPEGAPPLLVQPPPVAARGAALATPDDGIVVSLAPGEGGRARVILRPRPANVQVVNDVVDGGGCDVFVVWDAAGNGGAPQLRVRGQWDDSCGRRDVASVRAPASVRFAPAAAQAEAEPASIPTPRLVAELWSRAGGRLGGRVIETDHWDEREHARPLRLWASRLTTPLPDLIHTMNKTSHNGTAHNLLLSLSPREARRQGGLQGAQSRVQEWLREQGLNDGDIRIDHGSGLSRTERGKPRALAQLLCKAWRASGSKVFVDSLPIAGVDGTLAHRMGKGAAKGQAYLKTGTLRDTRALAGYVRARSGKVYAVAAMVNHPQAARPTPALDAMIEWVAKNG